MADPDQVIEASLLSGTSDGSQVVSFKVGMQSTPISVGTAGQWRITAAEVAPIHLYLAFDGKTVHLAAAAAHLPVLLAGNPLRAGWTAAQVPCEVRFGRACITLRYSGGPQGEQTVHDGGALWHAAQRAVTEAVRRAHGTPAPPAESNVGPLPGGFGTTQPMEGAPPIAPGLRVVGGAGGPSPFLPQVTPGGALAGPVAGTRLSSNVSNDRAAYVALPGDPGAPQDEAETENKGAWQSASWVKKMTLVLLPFAMVGGYFMVAPQPETPATTAHTVSGHAPARPSIDAGAPPFASVTEGRASVLANANGNDAAAAEATGASAPSYDAPPAKVASGPQAKAAPIRHGQRTLERQALDTAAAGSFGDAANLYDTHAASHPDDPSYKDAARILRDKAGRAR